MYPLAKLSDLAKIPLTFPFAPPLGASARWPTRQAGADQLFGSYPSRAVLLLGRNFFPYGNYVVLWIDDSIDLSRQHFKGALFSAW